MSKKQKKGNDQNQSGRKKADAERKLENKADKAVEEELEKENPEDENLEDKNPKKENSEKENSEKENPEDENSENQNSENENSKNEKTAYADDGKNNEDIEQTSDDEEDNEDKKNAVIKEILSWVKVFVVAFIVAFILSNFVIVNARVPSGSMKNTINEGDKVIGFRLSYLFSSPKRGDIVMFYAPDKENTIYIKRVIGVPGDRIVIKDNKLYINDELITENYVQNPWTKDKGKTVDETIPKGEYYMMGDNRDNSNDSRAWGTVKKDKIIAKAIFRYYPSFKRYN